MSGSPKEQAHYIVGEWAGHLIEREYIFRDVHLAIVKDHLHRLREEITQAITAAEKSATKRARLKLAQAAEDTAAKLISKDYITTTDFGIGQIKADALSDFAKDIREK